MLTLLATVLLAQSGTAAPAPGASPTGTPVELFNGRDLAGWKALGDARWSVENGELIGAIGGGSQSFLATERSYGDFRLELDVKTELPGNSGIQIRSHVNDQGRLFGYQIEIDPSERAWSGGLYDEARRGWLQDLEGRDEARAAFQHGEWNRYAIECRGPWIRTWIDGVPITDYLDPLDAEGLIGLQVHSGDNTRVRWRNFVMTDLGRREWRPVETVVLEYPKCTLHREHDDPCTGDLAIAPEEFVVRWSWDPAIHEPGIEIRENGEEFGEQAIVCSQGGADGTVTLFGGTWGGKVLVEGLAREDEGMRQLAVVRSGPRLRIFLDGKLIHRQEDFAAPEMAALRFSNYRTATALRSPTPLPLSEFELLMPASPESGR